MESCAFGALFFYWTFLRQNDVESGTGVWEFCGIYGCESVYVSFDECGSKPCVKECDWLGLYHIPNRLHGCYKCQTLPINIKKHQTNVHWKSLTNCIPTKKFQTPRQRIFHRFRRHSLGKWFIHNSLTGYMASPWVARPDAVLAWRQDTKVPLVLRRDKFGGKHFASSKWPILL